MRLWLSNPTCTVYDSELLLQKLSGIFTNQRLWPLSLENKCRNIGCLYSQASYNLGGDILQLGSMGQINIPNQRY